MPATEVVNTWREKRGGGRETILLLYSDQVSTTPSVSVSELVLSRWTARLEPSVMMKRLTANITSRAGSRSQYLCTSQHTHPCY